MASIPITTEEKPRAWFSRSYPAARLDRAEKQPCDLYFIETECQQRFVKIGIAGDVNRRLKKMQMGCPYELKVLAVIPGGAHMEKELHVRFLADRVTGEWFKRSDALLAAIDELRNPPTSSV